MPGLRIEFVGVTGCEAPVVFFFSCFLFGVLGGHWFRVGGTKVLLLGLEELAVVASVFFVAGLEGGGQMTVGSPFPLTDAQGDGL